MADGKHRIPPPARPDARPGAGSTGRPGTGSVAGPGARPVAGPVVGAGAKPVAGPVAGPGDKPVAGPEAKSTARPGTDVSSPRPGRGDSAAQGGDRNAALPESGFSLFRTRQDRVAAQLTEYMPALEAARRRSGAASSRWLLLALCLLFFLFLLWASFAELDETVVGMGQVIPSQRVQHIQNLEGGILREILVKEGQQVERGALLLRIDNEQAGSLLRDTVTKSLELEAAIGRLRAEIDGDQPAYSETLQREAPEIVDRHNALLEARRQKDANQRRTLEAQRDLRKLEEQEQLARRKSLEESLTIAARQRDMARKLMAARSYSEMEYLNMEQRVVQLQGDLEVLDSTIPKLRAGIREAEEKLLLHQAEANAKNMQELNEANAELATLREILVAGTDRVTRTEVRSPVHGVIKRINITTEGGVIMPGEVIMDVVPLDDSLLVEARVNPQDIAFLFVGQKARIRLTAYDFAIYGALDAELEHISADTIEGKQGEIFYLVRLRTLQSTLEHNGAHLPILPGMTATADIITGRKTVLDYLVKPILKAKQEALRER